MYDFLQFHGFRGMTYFCSTMVKEVVIVRDKISITIIIENIAVKLFPHSSFLQTLFLVEYNK